MSQIEYVDTNGDGDDNNISYEFDADLHSKHDVFVETSVHKGSVSKFRL